MGTDFGKSEGKGDQFWQSKSVRGGVETRIDSAGIILWGRFLVTFQRRVPVTGPETQEQCGAGLYTNHTYSIDRLRPKAWSSIMSYFTHVQKSVAIFERIDNCRMYGERR